MLNYFDFVIRTTRIVMFRIAIKGLFFMSLLISNLSLAARAPLKTNDPYLWLEEIEGEKALSWVKDENKKTFNTFSKKKGFSNLKNQIFNDLGSKHKIPHGQLFEGYVYKEVQPVQAEFPVALRLNHLQAQFP